MRECIPTKPLPKHCDPPWLSGSIRFVRKRNAQFQKAKRSKQTSHHVQYRRLRNRITNMIRTAKRNYFGKLNTFDSKDFWKAFKIINNDSHAIPTLENDGIEASSDSEKAKLLNEFFSTSLNTSAPPLCSTSISNQNINISSTEILCTEEEVCHLLKQLDKANATGPDGILARMLKETASTITPSVTELFNLSLHQQTFPSQWKYANVVPIPKNSASKSSPNNYRPIALLPIVSKVFEKYIHSIISDHLDENCPIPTNQWDFSQENRRLQH